MKEREERYLEAKGNQCPYCQSRNIEAIGWPTPEGTEVYNDVECLDCGLDWVDVYTLTGVILGE